MSLDQQAQAAVRRLNADLREIQKSPIQGVSAFPLEDDVFEVRRFRYCTLLSFFFSLVIYSVNITTCKIDSYLNICYVWNESTFFRCEIPVFLIFFKQWHCNFTGPEGTSWAKAVFHVILYFPKEYPAKSPSCEFVPEFQFTGGASTRGKKVLYHHSPIKTLFLIVVREQRSASPSFPILLNTIRNGPMKKEQGYISLLFSKIDFISGLLLTLFKQYC